MDRIKLERLEPRTTDTQTELFSKIHKLLGLGGQIGPKFWGAFGVFSVDLSAPVLVLESLVHVFHQSTIISTKKTKPLYPKSQIFIWDWDLNLGRKELGI